MPATTLDTNQLARLFDVTPRHIRRLTSDAVLQKARDIDGTELRGRYELLFNVRAYVKYLRQQARLDDTSESKYIMLRNQKMAAEAEMSELRLRLFKNTLHRAEDVEFIMTNMLTAFKSRVLAIPAKISRLLIGARTFQAIYETIMTAIEEALRELSGYNQVMFAQASAAYLASLGADPSSLNGQRAKEEAAPDEGDETIPTDPGRED